MKVTFAQVRKDDPFHLPTTAHVDDAGFDLYASEETRLEPGTFVDVPTNTALDLPLNSWGLLTGRSSTLRRAGVLVAQGVIDEGYVGELFFGCWNLTQETVVVEVGDRLAQLIIVPRKATAVKAVLGLQSEFKHSTRRDSGFGSSGR